MCPGIFLVLLHISQPRCLYRKLSIRGKLIRNSRRRICLLKLGSSAPRDPASARMRTGGNVQRSRRPGVVLYEWGESKYLVSRTMSRRGSRNPPQISSAFTSTAVIPFPGGNFANPANPISEDTERLPGLNEPGELDGARFCDRWWKPTNIRI